MSPADVQFWLFFVYCLFAVFIFLIISFYTNRILGWGLSWILRVLLERRYRAHVSIESVRIAFLGGRILFKNLRYQSTNQSIHVLQGHLTFRHWRWRVLTNKDAMDEKQSRLPCRIHIYLNGLEWFMYNRTPAYDYLETFLKEISKNTSSNAPSTQDIADGTELRRRQQSSTVSSLNETWVQKQQIHTKTSDPKQSWWYRALPIDIELGKSAVVIGNHTLPTITILTCNSANGVYKVSPSRSKLDLFKYVLSLNLNEVKAQLRTNIDHKDGRAFQPPKRRSYWSRLGRFFLFPKFRRKRPRKETLPFTGSETWNGLDRYQNQEARTGFSNADEYAKVTSIAEFSRVSLIYYCDDPGTVPNMSQAFTTDTFTKANGDLPPEWGAELKLVNSMIHYGPWADKNRSLIQNFFFPYAYRTVPPTELPKIGDTRVFTTMNWLIEFSGVTTWRVPTKESSKDWKYKDNEPREAVGVTTTPARPYGWLDIKFSHATKLIFSVPMIFKEEGYTTSIELRAESANLSSSVNYANAVTLKQLQMNIEMPSPRSWKEPRTWKINLTCSSAELFLLRDHVTLFQDFIADWNNRPVSDIDHFIPYAYDVQLQLNQFSFYLCANEQNVVSLPNDLEENAYLILSSPLASVNLSLPYLTYEPLQNTIHFDVEIYKISAAINLASSSTIGAFMTDEQAKMGTIERFTLNGEYEYCDRLYAGSVTDRMTFSMHAYNAEIKLFGFFVRYLIFVGDNYFGDNINFVTLDEYRSRNTSTTPKEQAKNQDFTPTNFEVQYSICIDGAKLLLPENIYKCATYSTLECIDLSISGRNSDFLGEIQIDTSPIVLKRKAVVEWEMSRFSADEPGLISLDSLSLSAKRYLGSPPKFPVYLSNWQFYLDRIHGEISLGFFVGILTWMKCFTFTLFDHDNSLQEDPNPFASNLPALSFLQLEIKCIELCIWLSPSHVGRISLPERINLEFDTFINELYKDRMILDIPIVSVNMLSKVENQPVTNQANWIEVARVQTGLHVGIIQKSRDWEREQKEQVQFLTENDKIMKRCSYLYESSDNHSGLSMSQNEFALPFAVPGFEADFDIEDAGEKSNGEYFFEPDLRLFRRTPKPKRHIPSFTKMRFAASGTFVPLKGEDTFVRHQTSSAEYIKSDFFKLKGDHENQDYIWLHFSDSMRITISNFAMEQLLGENLDVFDPQTMHMIMDSIQIAFMHRTLALDSPPWHLHIGSPKIAIHVITAPKKDGGTTSDPTFIDISVVDPLFEISSFPVEELNRRSSAIGILFHELTLDMCWFNLSSHDITRESASICSLRLDRSTVQHETVVAKDNSMSTTAHLGKVSCQMDENIHDIVEKVTDCWLNSILLVISKVKFLLQNRVQKQQQLFFTISEYSMKNEGADPVFLSMPSNLWRLRMKEYQITDSWKLLSHFRHCLKLFETDAMAALITSFVKDHSEMINLTNTVLNLKRWRYWEIDDLSRADLLELVFKNQSSPQSELKQHHDYLVKATELGVGIFEENFQHASLKLHDIRFNGRLDGQKSQLLYSSNITKLEGFATLTTVEWLTGVGRLKESISQEIQRSREDLSNYATTTTHAVSIFGVTEVGVSVIGFDDSFVFECLNLRHSIDSATEKMMNFMFLDQALVKVQRGNREFCAAHASNSMISFGNLSHDKSYEVPVFLSAKIKSFHGFIKNDPQEILDHMQSYYQRIVRHMPNDNIDEAHPQGRSLAIGIDDMQLSLMIPNCPHISYLLQNTVVKHVNSSIDDPERKNFASHTYIRISRHGLMIGANNSTVIALPSGYVVNSVSTDKTHTGFVVSPNVMEMKDTDLGKLLKVVTSLQSISSRFENNLPQKSPQKQQTSQHIAFVNIPEFKLILSSNGLQLCINVKDTVCNLSNLLDLWRFKINVPYIQITLLEGNQQIRPVLQLDLSAKFNSWDFMSELHLMKQELVLEKFVLISFTHSFILLQILLNDFNSIISQSAGDFDPTKTSTPGDRSEVKYFTTVISQQMIVLLPTEPMEFFLPKLPGIRSSAFILRIPEFSCSIDDFKKITLSLKVPSLELKRNVEITNIDALRSMNEPKLNQVTIPAIEGVIDLGNIMSGKVTVSPLEGDIDTHFILLISYFGAMPYSLPPTVHPESLSIATDEEIRSFLFSLEFSIMGGQLFLRSAFNYKSLVESLKRSKIATDLATRITLKLPYTKVNLENHSHNPSLLLNILIQESANVVTPHLLLILSEMEQLVPDILPPTHGVAEMAVSKKSPPFTGSLAILPTRFSFIGTSDSKVQLDVQTGNVSILFSDLGFGTMAATKSTVVYIEDLAMKLRHEYAQDACLDISIPKITGQFAQLQANKEYSVILQIHDIIGKFNIRQLNDLFAFQSVWMSNLFPKKKKEIRERPKGRLLPSSMRVLVRVTRVNFTADLTQSIGMIGLKLENFKFRMYHAKEFAQTIVLSTDLIEINSTEGRLRGVLAGLVNLKVVLSAWNTQLNPSQSTFSSFVVEVKRFLTSLEYNNERIAVMDIEPLCFAVRDRWVNPQEVELDFEFVVDQINGILSKDSVPCFIRVSDKLTSMIYEKAATNFSAQKNGEFFLWNSISTMLSNFRPVLHIKPSFVVSIKDIQLSLFKQRFDPSQDCMQIKLLGVLLVLSEVFDPDQVLRELKLTFSDHAVIKKLSKKEEKNMSDVHKWSITQWNTHMNQRSSRLILDLPPADVQMESQQRRTDPHRLQYAFYTEFSGPIDVNLNFGFLKFLQEIASEFGEQFSATVKEIRDFLNIKEGMTEAARVDALRPVSRSGKLTFVPVRPIRFEPRLKVIEGASSTDVLRWVGIHQESLPVSIHEALTVSLEKTNLLLIDLYLGALSFPIQQTSSPTPPMPATTPHRSTSTPSSKHHPIWARSPTTRNP